MMTQPLLQIDNLHTYFYSRGKRAFVRSVSGVSLEIASGDTLGVVGESGSGKSITALSVMGLISAGPGVISGSIHLNVDGQSTNLLQDLPDYVSVSERDGRIMQVAKDETGWRKYMARRLRGIRGKTISMIFQNPKSSLNPYMTVGKQITENIYLHTSITGKQEACERALYWLERVKIDSPRLRYKGYPYGLSGGMCQRVMVAMALSAEPTLLIADEPTTGLDATIQSKIIDLLQELKLELGITTMLISHDISVISRLADSVAVMYGGTVVEYGPVNKILSMITENKHPYTNALLASIPDDVSIRKGYLQSIEGEVLDAINLPSGCRFYDRCDLVTEAVRNRCCEQEPSLTTVTPGHKVRCWHYSE